MTQQQFQHWPSYDIINLHDYQKVAHDFIMNTPYCSLMLDMGLGKTATTLSALYDLNPNGHVLVIAPLNIARSTWIDEIEKWQMPLRHDSLIINEKGRKLDKNKRHAKYEELFTREPTVWFINKENTKDLVNWLIVNKGGKWPFPIVIIDESQAFKSPQAARFKALKQMRPQMERVIELTGTPAPNGLEDLWSQMYLLDMGERLGKSITAYRQRYFYPGLIVNGNPVNYRPLFGAEDAIYKAIDDICISMKNNYIQLPPCTINDIHVHMDEKETKIYEEFKKEAVIEFEKSYLNPETGEWETLVDEVMAESAAVLAGRLRQMASGAIYVNGTHDYNVIHNKKLEHLAYLLRQTHTPVLVAYHFKSDLELIDEYLNAYGFEHQIFDGSPEMVHAWNRDEIPVMLLQPASAGHGLNLQTGSGHTLIWYTLPWSLEQYLQCNARLYRQGQKNPVVIHRLLTADTIDDAVVRAIEKKDMSQQALLDAVKAQI